MARVLYTSSFEGCEVAGLVEARDLADARDALTERGHSEVRLWTHPVLGDAPGADLREALARVPRPSAAPLHVLAWLGALAAPGSVAGWVIVAAHSLAEPRVEPPAWLAGYVVVSLALGTLVSLLAWPLLREALAQRLGAAAYPLLSVLRAVLLPLAPLMEPWAVRVRAERLGRERAIARYAWLTRVGMSALADELEDAALDQMQLHARRAARLRARTELRPSAAREAELALVLAIDVGDADGASQAIARGAALGGGRVEAAVRELAALYVALDRGEAPTRASIDGLRDRHRGAWKYVGRPAASLLTLAEARAAAQRGEPRVARRLFASAATALLWRREERVLDRAARDLDASRAAMLGARR